MSQLLGQMAAKTVVAGGQSGPAAFVSKSTVNDTQASTSHVQSVDNTSLSTGDLLVAFIVCKGSTSITGPSGWSEFQQIGGDTSTWTRAGGVWTRVVTGSEASTYTWTAGSSSDWQGVVLAYSGQAGLRSGTDAYDRIDNTTGGTVACYTGDGTLSGVSCGTGDVHIVYMMQVEGGTKGANAPTGFTTRALQLSSNSKEEMFCADKSINTNPASMPNWTNVSTFGREVFGTVVVAGGA